MNRVVTETPNMYSSNSFYETGTGNASTNGNGFFSNFNGTSESNAVVTDDSTKSNIIRYLLIIVVLGFLGINLFSYLGNIVDFLRKTFGPGINTVLSFFGIAVGETAKTAIDIGSKGAKLGVDVAAGTVTTGINVLESTLNGNAVKNSLDSSKNSLNKAIENAQKNLNKEEVPSGPVERKPSSKIEGNVGFCYIGEYKGFRSCASIGESDKCLSGDIFPTREICINPNLRQ
jgi:hypothetical protein